MCDLVLLINNSKTITVKTYRYVLLFLLFRTNKQTVERAAVASFLTAIYSLFCRRAMKFPYDWILYCRDS